MTTMMNWRNSRSESNTEQNNHLPDYILIMWKYIHDCMEHHNLIRSIPYLI